MLQFLRFDFSKLMAIIACKTKEINLYCGAIVTIMSRKKFLIEFYAEVPTTVKPLTRMVHLSR